MNWIQNIAHWRSLTPEAKLREIAATVQARVPDVRVMLTLETLEYLRRGGRISGAQAMIGGLLSIKPILQVVRADVSVIERVRTRGKARARMVELMFDRPVERLVALHTNSADVTAFRDDIARRAGLDVAAVPIEVVGASVGPHVGPGAIGVVALYEAG
jgi:DegV family protein with EDD domain